jgi:chaperonin cofactor prefoldin
MGIDCEQKKEELEGKIATLAAEETSIVQRQDGLKKELYARFGDSINLEN